MAEPLFFERRARRPFGLVMVLCALGFLAVLIFAIDAHPLVVTLFALFSAPAVWDVIRDSVATLQLDDTSIAWKSGARSRNIALKDIEIAVLSTSLDLSGRATLHLVSGEKIRVPFECLPGARVLERALEARGVPHRRSFFSF